MNATNKPVVIKKGTIVGTFEPDDEIRSSPKEQGVRKVAKELPEQLQILLDRSSKHLDKTQKKKLEDTLKKLSGCIRFVWRRYGFYRYCKTPDWHKWSQTHQAKNETSALSYGGRSRSPSRWHVKKRSDWRIKQSMGSWWCACKEKRRKLSILRWL